MRAFHLGDTRSSGERESWLWPVPNEPIEPMDLANTRANGVRSLGVQCNQRRHRVIVDVDHFPGDLTVPAFDGSPSTLRSCQICSVRLIVI